MMIQLFLHLIKECKWVLLMVKENIGSVWITALNRFSTKKLLCNEEQTLHILLSNFRKNEIISVKCWDSRLTANLDGILMQKVFVGK